MLADRVPDGEAFASRWVSGSEARIAVDLCGWLLCAAAVCAGADLADLSLPTVIGGVWRLALLRAGWMIGMPVAERPGGVGAYCAAEAKSRPEVGAIRLQGVRPERAPSTCSPPAADALHV